MNQQSINFESLTRNSDPETSREAAETVARSITKREAFALSVVACYPYRTAAELELLAQRWKSKHSDDCPVGSSDWLAPYANADFDSCRCGFFDRYTEGMVRKRLAGLRKKGKVCNGPARVCRAKGTKAMTWRAV